MSSPFAAFARIALYENGVDGTSKKFEKTVTNNDDKKKKNRKTKRLKDFCRKVLDENFSRENERHASGIQIKLKRECLQRAAWPSCHLGGRDQADLARATSSKGAVAPR